jgi:hypothetical protein
VSIASHWRSTACCARHVIGQSAKQPVRLRDSIGGILCFEDIVDLIYEELAGPHDVSVRPACDTDAVGATAPSPQYHTGDVLKRNGNHRPLTRRTGNRLGALVASYLVDDVPVIAILI